MLMRFGIQDKLLSFNADNATNNDTQTTALANHDNSFESENRARCFTHVTNLGAKRLLHPFNTAITGVPPVLDPLDILPPDSEDDGEDDIDGDAPVDEDDPADDDSWFKALPADQSARIISDTMAVRSTVTKVQCN